MNLLTLALTAVLSQTVPETPAPTATPTPEVPSAADRAAIAAEKAAAAAERVAVAAEKLAGIEPKKEDPKADPPAVVDPWKGLISIGLVSLTGNADSLTATAGAQVDKKFGPWALGLRATGAYGQSRPNDASPSQVTALRAGTTVRGDRLLINWASLYVMAGLETDHVKSVELRGFGEIGTGLTLVEKKEGDLEKLYIRGDIAFRYSRETRYQFFGDVPAGDLRVQPAVTLVAPRFGATFRFGFNKHVKFSEEAEVLPNLIGASRVLVNSNTKLSARVIDPLSITAGFLLTFDSAPAPNKKALDTALTLGLEASF